MILTKYYIRFREAQGAKETSTNSREHRLETISVSRRTMAFLARFLLSAKRRALGRYSRTSRRYLFFWARNAIYHSLRPWRRPGDGVLVPALHLRFCR